MAAALASPAAGEANNRFYAEGRVSAGVSDTADDASDDGRFANVDAFTVLMPRGIFTRSSPRAHHLGSYTLSTRVNLRRARGNTLSNRVDWLSRIFTSRDGELSLGAGVHQGHTSAYDLALPRVVEPFPAGGIHFLSGEGSQRYGHRLGRAWHITQSAAASAYYPIEGDLEVAGSYQVGGGLDLRRRFRHETVTGSLRGRYVSISRPIIEGLDLPENDRHVVAGAEVFGSRALSARWTAELGAGVVGAAHVESMGDPLLLPSARASLRYALAEGSTALSYRHDIDSRLMVGETSAMHIVALSGLYPVPTLEDVWLAGALGYRNGRILDTHSGDFIGRSEVLLIDGQIAWEFRPGFTAAARVHTYQQRRDETSAALTGEQSRSQFMVTLSARFPADSSMPVPPGAGAPYSADPVHAPADSDDDGE